MTVEHSPTATHRAYPDLMASRPDHATGADYARLGVPATDEQVTAARDRARQVLAEHDAEWTPAKWAELDRLIIDAA